MGLKQLNWWRLSMGCQEKVEPLMAFDTWGFCTSLQTLLHLPHYTVPSAPKRYWLEAWESILQGSGLHEGNNSGKDTKLHLNLSALSLLKKKVLIYIFKRATSENLLQPQLGSQGHVFMLCPEQQLLQQLEPWEGPTLKTQRYSACLRLRPHQNDREHCPSFPITRLTNVK